MNEKPTPRCKKSKAIPTLWSTMQGHVQWMNLGGTQMVMSMCHCFMSSQIRSSMCNIRAVLAFVAGLDSESAIYVDAGWNLCRGFGCTLYQLKERMQMRPINGLNDICRMQLRTPPAMS